MLSTSDTDVLILSLNLLLRPAQQYSAQPAVSRALNISTPRLQSLAKRWTNIREYGISLADLVTASGKEQVEALPAEAREVQFSFYKTDGPDRPQDKAKDMDVDIPDPQQTPARKSSVSHAAAPSVAPVSGAVNVHVGWT